MLRRCTLTAAFALLVLVVGQLAALAHEADTRHVICADHGEELEAVTLAGADDGCENAHWVGVEGPEGEHAECSILHALHFSGIAPHVAGLVVVSTVLPAVRPVPPPQIIYARSRYRIAPKTSPPLAV